MSGIAKAFKKVWRPIEKLGSKMLNIGTFGLHKKWKKTRHKILKSKIFKAVVAVAAIYFGGAALLSMAGGGTASAGIGSAWSGVTGAGSALAAGNVSGAMSSIGAGWTGASAGATGFAAGQAAQATALNAAAPTIAGAGAGAGAGGATTGAATTPTAASLTAQVNAPLAQGVTGITQGGSAVTGASNAITVGGAGAGGGAGASGGLLSKAWNGLGQYGKGAVVSAGVNTVGQMMQGKAQQEAMEEARKRRTYWGVDGEGNTSQQPNGLLSHVNTNLNPQTNATPSWKTTLDDLINRQKQVVGGTNG